MNRLLSVNVVVWLLLVDINHHRWFIGTRCNGIVVRSFIAMSHHMRRRKAIAAIRMTVVQRNIMRYMQPPANVVGLDQPYRKDCTGENCRCLLRENSHDLGCLVEMGNVGSVADPLSERHPNQSTLDANGSGESVIGMHRDLCCPVMDEREAT